METINVSNRVSRQVLIICSEYRCKLKTCYFNNLIAFFKQISGRYYDQITSEWSFPIESLVAIKNFLTASYFPFKEVDAKFFARLYKSEKEILMGFDCFQHDFSIFKEIDGASYDREMSKYIVPIEKFDQLKMILIENKYNFLLNEDKTSSLIFPLAISVPVEAKQYTLVTLDNVVPTQENDDDINKFFENVNIFNSFDYFIYFFY